MIYNTFLSHSGIGLVRTVGVLAIVLFPILIVTCIKRFNHLAHLPLERPS